jgi:hypothetical protein
MNMIPKLVAFLILLCFPQSSWAQDKPLTPAEVRATAKDAYIFAYPLVLNYRTMYLQAIDSKAEEYVGGFGKYRSYGLATPADKAIVTPNNDTPYSWAWVDLRAQPWVVSVPEVKGGRYYTLQWDDLWGFVVANLGALELDGKPGYYLLARPDWKGETPKGISGVVKGESVFLGTLTRTGMMGPDDLPNVQAIQRQYRLQSLSEFLGQPAPNPAPEIKWPAWDESKVKTEGFFGYVNFLLQFTRPNPDDKPTLDRIARIGIAPGKPWEPAKMSAEVRKAIQDGIADAMKALDEEARNVKSAVGLFGDREEMGTRYLARSLGVVLGIFGNVPQQAMYFPLKNDTDGDPLDTGKHNYIVRFGADRLPPVKYFWSLTMYDLPDRFLVANPIDRYSIGSRSPQLKKAEDGSITIYMQKESPGKDKESNWLPGPNGLSTPSCECTGQRRPFRKESGPCRRCRG